MEIERKWLVEDKNFQHLKDECDTSYRIIQGYLNSKEDDDFVIRYRSVNDNLFMLEIKSKGLLEREELKYEITKEQFEEGFKLCQKTISKTRYLYVDKFICEMDEYDDFDFITVEVEFATKEMSNNFEPLWWFGREVTYDLKYKNINLAKQIKNGDI